MTTLPKAKFPVTLMMRVGVDGADEGGADAGGVGALGADLSSPHPVINRDTTATDRTACVRMAWFFKMRNLQIKTRM
jgi:hypothetical protein